MVSKNEGLIMNKNSILIKTIIILLFLNLNAIAKESNFFLKGKKLYEKNKFQESKILFERDLVFNPKSEKSYLYLAKIFSQKENVEEQERNLNSVLLLNPKNDEAIYMLALIKIKQSDYSEAKKLIDRFKLVCKNFCSKESEMNEKLTKLTPEDAKKIN
tara:strand:+ start:470 stop:946 length:477 start_codon:yes stop_codon:yes gene_type:complete